jgi:hypothetical protein
MYAAVTSAGGRNYPEFIKAQAQSSY